MSIIAFDIIVPLWASVAVPILSFMGGALFAGIVYDRAAARAAKRMKQIEDERYKGEQS